ncbi:MAG: PatB family C-S lyase [Bacteroidaceae bacterium]|nr:PatB family C-S lyase [Bacteroidaceae bacterium]
MNYDFDRLIDRSGTGDVKHCKLQEFYGRSDLLPLWVADTEFETPPFITEALRRRLEHSLFGYTVTPEALWTAVGDWLLARHGWQVERSWLTFIPGIVKGIGLVVNCLLDPDERVIIQPPVYHPFRLVPQHNGRLVVTNPLIEERDADGALHYRMDFNGLETLARDPQNRLLILSNPHNPAGIVWEPETLRRVAAICAANDVLVISDEIHCDMTLFGHRHTPFATVSPEAAQCSITFGAPSKTFNIAGIVSSYAIVPNDSLRRRFYGWLDANEFADPHLFAPIATIAAFSPEGEEWRQQMVRYVEGNVQFVEDFCREQLPQIRPVRPEASYLVWLDCRALGLEHDALTDLFVNRARLALNDGEMFGSEGRGFMRLNVGCPRSLLQQAMEQLRAAICVK